MYIHFLTENTVLVQIALKAGTHVVISSGEADAYLNSAAWNSGYGDGRTYAECGSSYSIVY
jgi:hypothetical protein